MQSDIGIVNIQLRRGNNKAYTLSFLQYAALKALQEAMNRIERLENQTKEWKTSVN